MFQACSEEAYLESTLGFLDSKTKAISKRLESLSEEVICYKKDVWENIIRLDYYELMQSGQDIDNQIDSGARLILERNSLNKAKSRPYFARVDFSYDDDTEEDKDISIYIGITSIVDDDKHKFYAYDWRAPISSLFYEFELGEAYYKAPAGMQYGKISLKRHFKIEDGKIKYFVDSGTNFNDDVLMECLAKSSDSRMHNIVTSIQREQNIAIRDTYSDTLIVQGAAGSGKTAIALHRAAYLLYKYKGKITSKEILIISPNPYFSEYISGVLPELDEENVYRIEMEELAKEVLPATYNFETALIQSEKIIACENAIVSENGLFTLEDNDYVLRAKFKSTCEFAEFLKDFVEKRIEEAFKPIGFRFLGASFTSDFLRDEFLNHKELPPKERLKRLYNSILVSMPKNISALNRIKLLRYINSMYKPLNPYELYEEFYKYIGNYIGSSSYFVHDGKNFEFADLYPMAYVYAALNGYSRETPIKHLIVDEMQDYSPIAFSFINELFKCKKTILGDVNQSASGIEYTLEDICRSFKEGSMRVYELNNSYRSTHEIIEFSKEIRPETDGVFSFARHGSEVEVIQAKDKIACIKELLSKPDVQQYKRVGIICKDTEKASELAKSFENSPNVSHITSNKDTKIVISPIGLSKGLEFDYVIVVDADIETYCSEVDRNLLYVACTRAMHKLDLIYEGKKSKFI